MSIDEVAKVFEAASGRFYWYWSHPVTGGRWDARLRFYAVKHPWDLLSMTVADVLAREEKGGTGIWLTHRASGRVGLGLILGAVLWVLFLSIFLYSLLSGGAQNVSWNDVWPLLAAPFVILAAFKITTANADKRFAMVIDLLRAKAQAREVAKVA